MKNKDIIVTGFALFAMFFGAGNLIFPPFLGVITGNDWSTGFLGFVIADVGLALIAVIAAAKSGGNIESVLEKCGKKLALILGILIMICLGPLVAIPRTAATTFEMGVIPILPQFNQIIFTIIFFVITIVLTIKPSKVVDIIGSVLTPALLIALGVLIVKGIVSPLGSTTSQPIINNVFAEGIAQGYQTMDALAAVALSSVIMISLTNKGYENENEKIKVTVSSAVLAGVGLALVYGGLTYLGATVSNKYGIDSLQTVIVVQMTEMILGDTGKIILSAIVSLACLTTAIGLTSATAQYFSDITKGKLKYEIIVILICVFSAVVSNFGVSSIIEFAGPILNIVYPATIVIVIMTLFDKFISNDNVFKGATYMAIIISILTIINSNKMMNIPYINQLPLTVYGFNWVVPVIIGGVVGGLIPNRKK